MVVVWVVSLLTTHVVYKNWGFRVTGSWSPEKSHQTWPENEEKYRPSSTCIEQLNLILGTDFRGPSLHINYNQSVCM